MLLILLLVQLVNVLFAHPRYDAWNNTDADLIHKSLRPGTCCVSEGSDPWIRPCYSFLLLVSPIEVSLWGQSLISWFRHIQ